MSVKQRVMGSKCVRMVCGCAALGFGSVFLFCGNRIMLSFEKHSLYCYWDDARYKL